jgi:hypothetical protein
MARLFSFNIIGEKLVGFIASPMIVKIFFFYRFNETKFKFDVTTFSEIIKEVRKSPKSKSGGINAKIQFTSKRFSVL